MTGFTQVITLIGAGGKTTMLQSLTQEISDRGQNVIATTTTKVYPVSFGSVWPEPVLPPPLEIEYPCFWYAGLESENKWIGPTVDQVDEAIRRDQAENKKGASQGAKKVWVIEGDGAREKKLKCWGSHEPQIPTESQCAVLIVHGGLWGKVLTDEEVHRGEMCPGIIGEVWTREKALEYILNSPVFYPRYKDLFWIVLFNEYEDKKDKKDNDDVNFEIVDLKKGDHNTFPAHLRIASGNVKEGLLLWYDLW